MDDKILLKGHAEKHKELLYESPQPTFTLNIYGKIFFVNRYFCEMLGYPEKYFTGKNLFDLPILEKQEKDKVRKRFAACMDNKKNEPYRICFLDRKGDEKHCIMSDKPIIQDGQAIGLLVIMRDTTLLSEKEDDVRNAELLFSETADSVGEYIHIIDQNYKITYMNKAFIAHNNRLGLSTNTVGKDLFIVFPFLKSKVRKEYEHVFKTGKSLRTEEKTLLDDEKKSTNTIKIALKQDDKVIRVLTIMQDNTAYQKIITDLEHSNKKYYEAYECAPIAYQSMDSKGMIKQVNPAWCHATGYTQEDVKDEWFGKFLTPKGQDDFQACYSELRQNGRIKGKKLEFIKKDGQVSLMQYSGRLDNNNIHCIMQDMTEQELTKDLLHKLHELMLCISAEYDMEQVYKITIEKMVHSNGFSCGGIYWKNPNTGEYHLQYSAGLTKKFRERTSHYDQNSIQAKIVEMKRPFFGSYELSDLPFDQEKEGEGIKSIAIIPIISGSEVLGCLNLGSHTEISIPSEIKQTLTSLGLQLGLIISRNRLHRANQHILDDNPNGIAIVQDEQLSFCNKEAMKCLGHLTKSISVEECFKCVCEEQRALIRERFAKLQEGEPLEPAEYRLKDKQGNTKHILMTSKKTYYLDKQAIIVCFQDITEKKMLLEKSIEDARQMKDIIENIEEVIFSLDKNRRITYISGRVEKLLGYSPQQIIGKDFGQVLSQGEDLKEFFESIMQGKSAQEIISNPDSEDKQRWLSISANPSFDEEKLNSIRGVITDITKQKEIEDEKRLSEEKYKNIFRTVRDAIILIDTSNHTIIEANESARNLHQQKELIRQHYPELTAEPEKAKNLIKNALRWGKVQHGVIYHKGKDGKLLPVEISGGVIEVQGKSYISLILRNLGDKYERDEQLRQKLLRFDMTKGKVYYCADKERVQAKSAISDLVDLGYEAIMITRQTKEEIKKVMGNRKIKYRWLTTSGNGDNISELSRLKDLLEQTPIASTIFIDSLDFIIEIHGIEAATRIVYLMREKAYLQDQIILLCGSEKAFSRLGPAKKEIELLRFREAEPLSQEEVEIMHFIRGHNARGIRPSLTMIGKHFHLSKPTVRSKIRRLVHQGYAKQIKMGRKKAIELTDRSHRMF